jgi:hypothetical protein
VQAASLYSDQATAQPGLSRATEHRNLQKTRRRNAETQKRRNAETQKRRNAETQKQRIMTILATLMPSAGVRKPRMSPSGGKATIESASDYVSTFRGEGVEPDLVALPVGLRLTFRGDECRSASRCPVRAGLRFYVSRRRPWGRGHVWWWWEASAWSQLAGLGLSRRQLLSGKTTALGVAPLRTTTDQIARKATKSCAGACHPARSAERIKARSPVSRNWAELRDALGRQRP